MGEVVVPVGTSVKFILTSTDVLHSFFIPNFRVKRDCVPNHYSSVYINAESIGNYHIFCTGPV